MQRIERLDFISIIMVLDSAQVDIWWHSNTTRCSEVSPAEQWPLVSPLNFYLTVLPTGIGIIPLNLVLVKAVGVTAKSQYD